MKTFHNNIEEGYKTIHNPLKVGYIKNSAKNIGKDCKQCIRDSRHDTHF